MSLNFYFKGLIKNLLLILLGSLSLGFWHVYTLYVCSFEYHFLFLRMFIQDTEQNPIKMLLEDLMKGTLYISSTFICTLYIVHCTSLAVY